MYNIEFMTLCLFVVVFKLAEYVPWIMDEYQKWGNHSGDSQPLT